MIVEVVVGPGAFWWYLLEVGKTVVVLVLLVLYDIAIIVLLDQPILCAWVVLLDEQGSALLYST